MRPQVIQLSSSGPSAWIPLDYKQSPFNVGFGVVLTGTATFTIEHTFEDVFDSTVTPTAFPHNLVYDATVSTDGNYAFPIRAVRVNVTSYGSGTITMTLLQGLR